MLIPLKWTDYKNIKYGSLFVQYIIKAIFSTIALQQQQKIGAEFQLYLSVNSFFYFDSAHENGV